MIECISMWADNFDPLSWAVNTHSGGDIHFSIVQYRIDTSDKYRPIHGLELFQRAILHIVVFVCDREEILLPGTNDVQINI